MLERNSKYFQGDVLDFGCGEMPYRDYILKHASTYRGVDWPGTKHELRAEVFADLNKSIPLADEIADTIVSFSVLEHLYNPLGMLNEANRILKTGGHLVLSVPWQWQVHEAPHDYYRYSPYGLRHLLSQADFSVVSISPTGGAFSTLALKASYLLARLARGPRPVRLLLRLMVLPIQFFLQLVAPILDRFDKNWSLEAPGYSVVAKKS